MDAQIGDQGDDRDHGHLPVLAARMAELLAPSLESGDERVLVDATLGAGGHAELMLNRFPNLRLVGIDRDAHALAIAEKRLAPMADRISLHQARFDQLPQVLADAAIDGIDGALFDLGVSSMQLDQPGRGFAYAIDAPLDMRMNDEDGLTAADVLNTYSHGELARVLSEYGEERFAGRIASAVIAEREKEPFTTSARLVALLYQAIPAATRRTGGHPAKRTFQALRIEVNHELDAIRAAVPAALDATRVGGRVAVMSYQSLEDRIIKREFATRTTSTSPRGLPVELPGTAPRFRLITRGAERPDAAELERNPRSAPVRVRVIERVAADHTAERGSRA
ncbi:S-adenosyl-methyltransferase MraW [Gordonia bronchialis DSM 43247]|uniref:Ribosomal RNA small subunit methyltransferase H n=2 Tax=Gordonia bronchialis TaxID=2054 RepID=D0LAT9_GORB4|nr:S-adenosyl-methyltransferase MraW [Gordonia bronchialis DSM 43247]STQ65156.1 Ribosomal RNA small subunit methyltransferase H [Gordonia bronchialis]